MLQVSGDGQGLLLEALFLQEVSHSCTLMLGDRWQDLHTHRETAVNLARGFAAMYEVHVWVHMVKCEYLVCIHSLCIVCMCCVQVCVSVVYSICVCVLCECGV